MQNQDDPEAPKDSHRPPTPSQPPEISVETLFRVTRAFLIPFLLSWMLAYVGGEREIEWIYYAGLGGVGVSVIGLLLWLLHH